jgi:hypothetical protein
MLVSGAGGSQEEEEEDSKEITEFLLDQRCAIPK